MKSTLFAKTAVLAVLCAVSAAKAENVDLTSFSLAGTGSQAPNFASVSGTSSLTATVSNVVSFDWQFAAGDYLPYNDYSYFIKASEGMTVLSDIAAVGDFGNSGWMTYTFASTYSGELTFGVANALDNSQDSQLNISNVVAVPEPETYALLMGGLGLVGFMARRKGMARS